MSWLGTIVTAIITAVVGALVSGYVADLSVRWYRISSFEGGSAYYTLMFAVGGALAGLIIGVIAARVVAANANPGLIKALSASVFIMLALIGVVGGVARLQADVPPQYENEELMLMVEARWPLSQLMSPAAVGGTSYVELGSLTRAHVQRIAKRGALWKEDAHKVDGRWTVPGAVPIFTERGARVLDIALNEKEHDVFELALPSHPAAKDFEWTEWYPMNGRGAATRDTGVTYRYRVQKVSQPVRIEHVGAFEIRTITKQFTLEPAPHTTTLDAFASFEVLYHGTIPPTTADASPPGSWAQFMSGMVVQLPGAKPALLVLINPQSGNTNCTLLVDDHGTLRATRAGESSHAINTLEITSDSARFHVMLHPPVQRGRLDRDTYRDSKFLLFDHSVLNVATLTVHPFTATSSASINASTPSIGMSPDERSFVRFATTMDSASAPLLVVTNYVDNVIYELPIDPLRMHYASTEEIDPAWLAHHFAWIHDDRGIDRLAARSNFTPLPFHGTLTTDYNGRQWYKIERGGATIQQAVLQMLEHDFAATRDSAADTESNALRVVDGVRVHVINSEYDAANYVMVSLDEAQVRSDLVARVAIAFNALLATGKYDAAFQHSTSH